MGVKTNAWDGTTPQGTESRRLGDNRIRDLKLDIDERESEEHQWGVDTSDTEGRHLEGSARVHRITGAEADPTLAAAHSEGRVLIRDGDSTPADDGLLFSRADALWRFLPVSPRNLNAHPQIAAAIANISNYVSDTVSASIGSGAYVAIPINAAATSVSYTPQRTGNILVLLFMGTSTAPGTDGDILTGAARFNAVVDEAAANLGSFRVTASGTAGERLPTQVLSVQTATAGPDTIEIVFRTSANTATFPVSQRRRLIVVEFDTST